MGKSGKTWTDAVDCWKIHSIESNHHSQTYATSVIQRRLSNPDPRVLCLAVRYPQSRYMVFYQRTMIAIKIPEGTHPRFGRVWYSRVYMAKRREEEASYDMYATLMKNCLF